LQNIKVTHLMGDDAKEMDRLCLVLFDSWCECRSVIPLAYLMYAWPILVGDLYAVTRLLSAMQELRQFHPEALLPDDHDVMERLQTIHDRAVNRARGDEMP
jgi:hypothetical protein